MGAGARAYIGYSASFWVWASPSTPERQSANEWIRHANVEAATALLQGKTFNYAVTVAREAYTDAYRAFTAASAAGVLDAEIIASTMLRNRNALVLSAPDLYATAL
jgi:hypothetical protein